MRVPKASIYHIAQSGKNKGDASRVQGRPRQVPTRHQRRAASAPPPNARRGRRARSRRLPSVHENHATMGARRKRAETPHPRRGDSRRVGDPLPEQTLHAWLDQQTKDGAPASNPTADDILAYAPEGSYARHCALIEKAAQDGLNGRLGLEGEYADNRRQLLAYRDGLARAGHEKAAQAIPAPGEWTRPANPDKGGGRGRAARNHRRQQCRENNH